MGEITSRYQIHPPERFDTIDSYLVARWRGDRNLPKTGTRPLTNWFNKQILKTVYTRQNRYQIDSHIESDYELLTSDNKSQNGDLQILFQDLREDGIDGEAITEDFISSSTLYRHLTNCLDAEKKRDTSDREWEREQISNLRERAATDLENVLTSLDNKNRIHGAADTDVSVALYLQCPECSREVSFRQAISRGHVCQEHLPIENPESEPPVDTIDDESDPHSDQLTLEQLSLSSQ